MITDACDPGMPDIFNQVYGLLGNDCAVANRIYGVYVQVLWDHHHRDFDASCKYAYLFLLHGKIILILRKLWVNKRSFLFIYSAS
jgi:hypothetical protein